MIELPMHKLYHGTLAQNIQSIRDKGLLPRNGLWTEVFHKNAVDLVYAVDEGRDRRPRIILAIIGQMAKSGLVQWTDDYQIVDFNNDLTAHGAVVVIKAASFCRYPPKSEILGHPRAKPVVRHPPGTEPGDWYSRDPVSIQAIEGVMIGKEMLDWLGPINDTDFTCRYREVLRKYDSS
jgi:hypothetical protein